MLDRGQDRRDVLNDRFLQFHEGRDPASAGAADPPVQGLFGLVDGHLKDQSQALFELVGAVEPRVGVGDPLQFGALLLGEVFRVLPQRVTGAVMPRARSVAGRGRASAGGLPGRRFSVARAILRASFQAWRRTRSKASVAHRTTWNGSAQRTAPGQFLATIVEMKSAPSADTWVI